jgi:hypothetical protein
MKWHSKDKFVLLWVVVKYGNHYNISNFKMVGVEIFFIFYSCYMQAN